MRKTRGFGIPARPASSPTMACSPGASAGETSRARFMRSTIRSEKK
jgi:hypothetical protein